MLYFGGRQPGLLQELTSPLSVLHPSDLTVKFWSVRRLPRGPH